MKILYIANVLCSGSLMKSLSSNLIRKETVKRCLSLSQDYNKKIFSDENIQFNKSRFAKYSKIFINQPGKVIKKSYLSYPHPITDIHGGYFNYYILTSTSPKKDFISLTPFYNLVNTKDFELKMIPVKNSYELFCKELIYNEVLLPYRNNLTCLSFYIKCLCSDLKDNTKDLGNLLNKYNMSLGGSSDIKTISEYFTDLSKGIDEKKISKEPVDVILDIIIKNHNVDNPDYKKLMPLINDIVNILNLYKNVRIFNYKEEFKPKVYKIDEDLLNKKEDLSKIVLKGKGEYSIMVEGISNKGVKKVNGYQIRGDDDDLKIVFDYFNLKDEGIKKVLIKINDNEKVTEQEVKIPDYLDDEEEPMILDYSH